MPSQYTNNHTGALTIHNLKKNIYIYSGWALLTSTSVLTETGMERFPPTQHNLQTTAVEWDWQSVSGPGEGDPLSSALASRWQTGWTEFAPGRSSMQAERDRKKTKFSSILSLWRTCTHAFWIAAYAEANAKKERIRQIQCVPAESAPVLFILPVAQYKLSFHCHLGLHVLISKTRLHTHTHLLQCFRITLQVISVLLNGFILLWCHEVHCPSNLSSSNMSLNAFSLQRKA